MSFFQELKRRNVVRVGIAYVLVGWVVLQAADFALDLVDAPNWTIQVFAIAVALGLPLALFFAWAFELTPEGIKREDEVDRSSSISQQTGRKLDRAIIVILGIAVTLLLVDRFTGRQAVAPGDLPAQEARQAAAESDQASADRSIAVLPLANRSSDPQDAFFAAGIHDELLTQLSRIGALRVISRTSVMGYAGTTKRMTEIGQELGVATLLEGSVQRAGDRVRINVQLIDAGSDEHLWAEIYDRELSTENLFDIQSDITRSIANALEAVLSGDEQRNLSRRPTDNLEAYAFYLQGRAASKGYGREINEIDESMVAFRRAIELDPQFAQAYAALSIDWTEKFWLSDKLGDELTHAAAHLQRAQALASDSPETLTAAGYYHYWGQLDYARAIAAFDRALAVNPGNTLAMRGKAYALRRAGELHKAVEVLERVVALDPLDGDIPADLAYAMMHVGRVNEARQILGLSDKLQAPTSFKRTVSAMLAEMLNEPAEAVKTLGAVDEQLPGFRLTQHYYLAVNLGDTALARRILALVPARYQRWALLSEAELLQREGQLDEAGSRLVIVEPQIHSALERDPESEQLLSELVHLRALQGDRAVLEEAIARYRSALRPDAMRIVEECVERCAYILTGQYDRALDLAQQMLDRFGPWELYWMRQDPLPEAMRAMPRFQALANRYDQWLAGVRAAAVATR